MSLVLESLARLSALLFVVSSMLALGSTYSIAQIVNPLRNVRLDLKALAANFVLAPLFAYGIILVIPLSDPLAIGLVLLATAAGAPFLPKLVEFAGGDIAYSVGMMLLLMVTTVIYVPVVLPFLLPGVAVNPLDIASSLIVLMLIPLVVGLLVNTRYPSISATVRPALNQAANTGLLLLIVLVTVLNFENIIGVIGTGAIVALLAFVVLTVAAGYLLGGPARETRVVSALGTGQRNIAAALVVAAQNFADPNVLVMLVVGSVVMFAILMPLAGELGKRTERTRVSERQAAKTTPGRTSRADEPAYRTETE